MNIVELIVNAFKQPTRVNTHMLSVSFRYHGVLGHLCVFYQTRGTLNAFTAHLNTHILSFPSVTCTRSEQREAEKYMNLNSAEVDNSINHKSIK